MCMSKSQAKCPLYRLSSMRKHLSINFRVPWDTTNLSVNPVLIVLEASLSSVNPGPIIWGQVRKHPCISVDKLLICDLLPGPSLLGLMVSGNVRNHSLASLQPPEISVEIFKAFIGTDESRMSRIPQGHLRLL